MNDNYLAQASVLLPGADEPTQLFKKKFEKKFDALRWAWYAAKHRDDKLDLGSELDKVDFVQVIGLQDDDNYYFGESADADDMVFIKALAETRTKELWLSALTDET